MTHPVSQPRRADAAARLIWRLSCGCCLRLSSTLKPLTKSFAAARRRRHSIGSKKPSNRKPSTALLRTDSARFLRSSTWGARRKFRELVSPFSARERKDHAASRHDLGGRKEG